MARLAKKEYVHNAGNKLVYYNTFSRTLIARTFSNFDVHFKTKLDFLALTEDHTTCSALAKYVFQNTAYTWLISAIAKHYDSPVYKQYKYLVGPAKLLMSTVLDTITDEEMKTIFDDFVIEGGYQNKSFIVNGKIEALTRDQVITVALVYALRNKDVISKELNYDSPMKKFVMRDIDGNKTKTCIESEKRRAMTQALRSNPKHKCMSGKKVKKVKVIKPVKFTDITLYSCKDSGKHSCTCNDCGTSCNEELVCNVSCNCDGNCKPATKPMKVTSTPKHVMKIDAIRNNIEKFACCVSAADEPDFKKTSDIIIAIMAASAASGDDTKNHDVADAVIKTSLKDKQHLVNIFEMIING